MNLYNETKFIMKQNNIIANKNLGQNFLINENVVDTIVDSAQIGKEDLIIEIGPGLGTLTSKLVEKAGKVICVEIDKKMIHILENRFQLYKNIEIINEDILKLNLEKIIKENKKSKSCCKFTILYNNTNNNEIIRRKIRYRKYNSNDSKRSG